MPDSAPNRAIIIMGVSGSGKTTTGKLLSERIKAVFLDADNFHPEANIKKMSTGIPLNDEDRVPWLDALHDELQRKLASGSSVVLACSALKRWYRERLVKKLPAVIVYLKGDYNLIEDRLVERTDHYMKSTLLESQFDTLEEPDESEAIIVAIQKSPETLIDEICREIEKQSETKKSRAKKS